VSELHNPETTLWGGTRRIKIYFYVVYGVAEEPMEVQEETIPFIPLLVPAQCIFKFTSELYEVIFSIN